MFNGWIKIDFIEPLASYGPQVQNQSSYFGKVIVRYIAFIILNSETTSYRLI